jgi:putative SOS response-associated peptidase YedK
MTTPKKAAEARKQHFLSRDRAEPASSEHAGSLQRLPDHTTIDTIVGQDGERRLVPMRWDLVPSWWSKPRKELKLATFNARAETVAEKPFFRGAFKRNRCLILVSGYYEWQDTADGKQPWYFTARDGSPALTIAGL